MNKNFIFIFTIFSIFILSVVLAYTFQIINDFIKDIYEASRKNNNKNINNDFERYDKNKTLNNGTKNEEYCYKKIILCLKNVSFEIDIFLGLILILLPVLNYYNIGKSFEKMIEDICYIIFIIGIILTLY